jgi:hypothetical protein
MTKKEHRKAYAKQYYKDNVEKIKLKSTQHYQDNIEKYKTKHRAYAKDNRERQVEYNRTHQKEYWNSYVKNRYKNDPSFKLQMLIRHRINSAITKGYKRCKSKELLGCEVSEAREYIESMFLPEMNWGNHGPVWELDHILPCASFDLTILEEQHKCFHFNNLQPLFKSTQIAESYGYKGYIGNREKGDNL